MADNPFDATAGRFIHAIDTARNELLSEIGRRFRPHPWPEAREDARLVLREYIAGLNDSSHYQMSEDEVLDKLGFGERHPPGGPFAT